MRKASQIRPLIERLTAVWERHPDLRLGQIIVDGSPHLSPFNIEDEAFINAIERQLGDLPSKGSE